VSRVTVYYSPWCPFCVMALRLLEEIGVEPEKIRVDLDSVMKRKMIERTGRTSVPQIFIGERHVGGCDELKKMHEKGKLIPLLEAEPNPTGGTRNGEE